METKDWYPKISTRIASIKTSNDNFIKEGKIIEGHFDTGATDIFISYEYLLELGILQSKLMFANVARAAFGGYRFKYFNVKMKIAIVGDNGETNSRDVTCKIVKDFDRSPFAKYYDRKALFGRNILNHFSSHSIELDYKEQKIRLITQDWKSFEKEVANLFLAFGLTVKRNINLSGNQIDVFLKEKTKTGKYLKTIVECKFYKSTVGVQILRDFNSVFLFAKSNNLAEHAIIVSSSGFTQDAFLFADTAGIELIEIDELRAKVKSINSDFKFETYQKIDESEPDESKPDENDAFVIMPFKDEYKDVYFLGIREILNKFNYKCYRADEIQYSDRILDKIIDLIKLSKVIIAEVSEPNPNVYYELGIAHTYNKPVILLTNDSKKIPFDLIGFNHIIYNSIIDLREKLSRRIKTLE